MDKNDNYLVLTRFYCENESSPPHEITVRKETIEKAKEEGEYIRTDNTVELIIIYKAVEVFTRTICHTELDAKD